MDVRVSPRATMCVLPGGGDGEVAVDDVDVAFAGSLGDDVLSPIITPGRAFPLLLPPPPLCCCCNFKICCESRSIFVFCSSSFLANASSLASMEKFGADERIGVCARSEVAAKKAQTIDKTRDIVVNFRTVRFPWQASGQFAIRAVRP